MATPTYTLIDSEVLASTAASVTFSSIPADYRDLILVCDASSTSGSARGMTLQFNSDTGSNYSRVLMSGDGSVAASSTITNDKMLVGRLAATGGRGISTIQVMDYSATDKHTSVLSRGNDAASQTLAVAGRWANTAAVTSITLDPGSNFESGNSFYLYGIVS